jgi:hypothetical protein
MRHPPSNIFRAGLSTAAAYYDILAPPHLSGNESLAGPTPERLHSGRFSDPPIPAQR